MSETAFPTVTSWTMQAADGYQACLEAWLGWQQELARFAGLRLGHNRHTWDVLLSSRDVTGVLQAQQEWAVRAATDYAQETARLAQLATSLSLTGTTPDVQESAALVA